MLQRGAPAAVENGYKSQTLESLLGPQRARVLVALIEQFTTYCDESWTVDGAFVIAGYVAPLEVWTRFGLRWAEVLQSEQIVEFKMNNCQQGSREFKGRDREQRRLLQHRLIDIIVSSGLTGVVSGLDLAAYETLAPQLRPLVSRQASKAYTLLFQHQVEATILLMQRLPSYERVSFVFDRQLQHQSNALAIYNSMRVSERSYCARMGPIAFEDSRLHPGLQAADLLAYELRRWLMEAAYQERAIRAARPQMQALNRGRIVGGLFDGGALLQLVGALARSRMLVTGDFDLEGRRRPSKRPRTQ